MNFSVSVSLGGSTCHLTIDNENNLVIMNQIYNLTIPLTLNQKICWHTCDNRLIGFEINNLLYRGMHEDLIQLKQILGQCVTFTKLLNMYTFCYILEDGTYSQICLLQCKITQQYYAVKCLKKMNEDIQDIIREIKIWRKLKHRTIAEFYEVYESTNTVYIVMEKLNKLRKDYDHEEIKLIMKEILEGVDYIHSQSVIHRDIKIENIMIDDANQIKIIDFGLSCQFANLETRYQSCGTPGYIAPEILKNLPYDHRCDIFSIGVVMYFLYCNKNLFYSEEIDEIVKMNKKFNLSQLSIVNIPDGGNQFLRGLLNPNPQQRLTIKQALDHWYLSSLKENVIKVPKSKKPKFKEDIKQQQFTFCSKTTIASYNLICNSK